MMFFDSPNYTQIPNDFFEKVLPAGPSKAEVGVALAIFRETFGFHRRETKLLTIDDLQAMTGLARGSVITGIREGEERGYIAGRRVAGGSVYGVRVTESPKIEPGESPKTGPPEVQILDSSSPKTGPGSNKGKESSKERGKKTEGDQLATGGMTVDAVIEEVFEAWRTGTGLGKGSKLTPARRKKIHDRLQECAKMQESGNRLEGARTELLEAVAGMVGSKWHQDQKQLDFTLIFRNGERVQTFRDRAAERGVKVPKADSIYNTTIENPELSDEEDAGA